MNTHAINWQVTIALMRLTFRQIATVKRMAIIAVLMMLVVGGALALVIADQRSQADDLVLALALFSTALPVTALIVAAPTFADEIEDRTLPILVLTPVPRWQIALPKLAAAFAIAVVPVSVAALAASLIVVEDRTIPVALAATIGTIFGCLCYSALFAFLGTLTGRAVIVGLFYIVGWEVILSETISTLGYLSIRQFSVSVTAAVDSGVAQLGDALVPTTGLPATLYAVLAGTFIVVATAAGSIWRLRTMDAN